MMYTWAFMPQCTCRGQRATMWSWFLFFTFTWVPGIKPWSSSLLASTFTDGSNSGPWDQNLASTFTDETSRGPTA